MPKAFVYGLGLFFICLECLAPAFGSVQDSLNGSITCRAMDEQVFSYEKTAESKNPFEGRTLIAFASWCVSCKHHLLESVSSPEKFVFLVAFDEVKAAEGVLKKFRVQSPCVDSETWVNALKIKSLPFSCVLDARYQCI